MSDNTNYLLQEDNLKENFTNALNATIGSFGENNKLIILDFITNLISTKNISLYTDPMHIGLLSESVFSDGAITDFLFSLNFHFYNRLSFIDFEAFQIQLCRNLEYSTRFVIFGDLKNNCLIPEEYIAQQSDIQSRIKLLQANNWVVMCLLINKYINVDTITTIMPAPAPIQ